MKDWRSRLTITEALQACVFLRILGDQIQQNNLRSEFIKRHYDLDHQEIYAQRGLKKVETLPFRVAGIATGRTAFTGRS